MRRYPQARMTTRYPQARMTTNQFQHLLNQRSIAIRPPGSIPLCTTRLAKNLTRLG